MGIDKLQIAELKGAQGFRHSPRTPYLLQRHSASFEHLAGKSQRLWLRLGWWNHSDAPNGRVITHQGAPSVAKPTKQWLWQAAGLNWSFQEIQACEARDKGCRVRSISSHCEKGSDDACFSLQGPGATNMVYVSPVILLTPNMINVVLIRAPIIPGGD